MTRENLKALMVEYGSDSNKTNTMIDAYKEIPAFTYMFVYNPNGKKPKSHCNYKKAFGNAYSEYGLYIFFMITIIKLYMSERLLKKNLKIDCLNILMSLMVV